MDAGIKGKTALVCAASKGLGKGCAKALGGEGVNLVITARGSEALEATAAELRAAFPSIEVRTVAGAGQVAVAVVLLRQRLDEDRRLGRAQLALQFVAVDQLAHGGSPGLMKMADAMVAYAIRNIAIRYCICNYFVRQCFPSTPCPRPKPIRPACMPGPAFSPRTPRWSSGSRQC
jgi:hypothetical protein